MLRALRLENYTLFDAASWEFGEGFTVLTGESGAGKSLVMEAITAALGARLPADRVGSGVGPLRIRAAFELGREHPLWAELTGWGIDPPAEDDDGWLIIQRELTREGRGTARLQGRPVPLQAIRQLAPQLVVVASQHQALRIVEPAAIRDWVDGVAGLETEQLAVRQAVAALREAERRVAEAGAQRVAPEEAAALREALSEIESLALTADEEERLAAELTRMRGGQRLWEGYHQVRTLLDGGNEAPGLLSTLGEISRIVGALARIDDRLAPLGESLREIEARTSDWELDLARWAEDLNLDPLALERVQERADRIARIKRKYGPSLPDVLAEAERIRRVLHDFDEGEWELTQAARRLAETQRLAAEAARDLSKRRRAAANAVAARLRGLVREMDMPGAEVELQIEPAPLSPHGSDDMDLLFSANPGQPLRPLSKVASGGEIARVALAMAVIGRSADGTAYLFDEVDAGLGGVSAARVGELLRKLGDTTQVIAISHQPSVAARAHDHWTVTKMVVADEARSRTLRVVGAAREDEVARMLSGSETGVALRHARELLSGESDGD
ncbi:MAG: AAA family ATPase [Thermaerobacter sp.]|nr:AAA family ATPase [Thermaerobacter sp.]